MPKESVLYIVEPVCSGYEHALVNASALVTLLRCEGISRIEFFGDDSHIRAVREIAGKVVEPIQFRPIRIPRPGVSHARRFIPEMVILARCIWLAKSAGARSGIIVTSMTSPGILSLAILLRVLRARASGVLHRDLESIARRPSLAPWRLLFWMGLTLRFAPSTRLHLIVLGRSILSAVMREMPTLPCRVSSMDMPYFCVRSRGRNEPTIGAQVSFGAVGVGSAERGVYDFLELSRRAMEATGGRATFSLIGQPSSEQVRSTALRYGVSVPTCRGMLSQSDYLERLSQVHYVALLFPVNSYRLSASAGFFDALRAHKPVIATPTEFVKAYFDRFGCLGYFVNGWDDAMCVVMSCTVGGLTNEYSALVQNCANACDRLLQSTTQRTRRLVSLCQAP